MRQTSLALVQHYIDRLDLRGDVLEIGAHQLEMSAAGLFPAPRFEYHDLNLTKLDIPNTIVADITDCREQVPDESFDVVVSFDVLEHIDRPWLAASEITRILRPGGVAITVTVWSWRNHPCPIDYWRFSPECLEFLFSDLTCLEKGYDLSQRRMDVSGHWRSGRDSVPIDELGGWRENWAVYHVARKGENPHVELFRDSDHELAAELRKDTQGTVTNPDLLGQRRPRTLLGKVEYRLTALEDALGTRVRGQAWTGARLTPRAADLARRLRGTGRHSDGEDSESATEG
jgi:SAM-dependent methyltransferase